MRDRPPTKKELERALKSAPRWRPAVTMVYHHNEVVTTDDSPAWWSVTLMPDGSVAAQRIRINMADPLNRHEHIEHRQYKTLSVAIADIEDRDGAGGTWVSAVTMCLAAGDRIVIARDFSTGLWELLPIDLGAHGEHRHPKAPERPYGLHEAMKRGEQLLSQRDTLPVCGCMEEEA